MLSTTDRIKELLLPSAQIQFQLLTNYRRPAANALTTAFTQYKNYIAAIRCQYENESFLYFSEHFGKRNGHTKIFAVNNEKDIYIQEDFGDVSLLLNRLEAEGFSLPVYELYKLRAQWHCCR